MTERAGVGRTGNVFIGVKLRRRRGHGGKEGRWEVWVEIAYILW